MTIPLTHQYPIAVIQRSWQGATHPQTRGEAMWHANLPHLPCLLAKMWCISWIITLSLYYTTFPPFAQVKNVQFTSPFGFKIYFVNIFIHFRRKSYF